MRREQLFSSLMYFGVATLSVGLAFALSLKFMTKSHSQEPSDASGLGSVQGVGTTAPAENNPNALAPPTANSNPSDLSDLQGFLEPFLYDASNRRDPFQPFIEFREERGLRPISKFDVDDFTLVGILWDNRDPKAMFIDPEQKVHIIGRDESIGRRNGYIAAIREGEVVVVESQRKQGDIVYKTKVIALSR